jgi:hypothetical protein
LKRVNKKDEINPNSLSNNYLNSEVNIHKKVNYKKYKKKEEIKEKINNINKLSMKEIFLPLRTNSFEKLQIKKVKYNTESYINIKKNNNRINISNIKSLSRTNDILYTLPNVKNKLINNISYDKIWKNNNKGNRYITSTSPQTFRNFFSQYKIGRAKNFIPNDGYINFKCCFTNANFSNNINETKGKNFEIRAKQIFPNVKKISLRNFVFDENYHDKEIQKYIFSKNETEYQDKAETENKSNYNNNLKKYDRLAIFVKYKNNNKNNNIKEENASNNNRCETFNKMYDSSRNYNDKSLNNGEKNYSSNNIKEMKGLFNTKKYDNYKGIKLNNSNSNKKNNTLYDKNREIMKYKDYLNEKYVPRRKGNKNDDILSILNMNNK